MTVEDILAPDGTLHALRADGKRACLEALSHGAARALGLEAAPVLAALLKRESLGSTGVGGGVALPHARLDGLDRPFGLLATLRTRIDYDAIDDRPVDLVFLLLLPAGPRGGQPDALACAARLLRDPAAAAALRGTRNAAELYAAARGHRAGAPGRD